MRSLAEHPSVWRESWFAHDYGENMSTANATPTVLQLIPHLDTGGAERTAVDVAVALAATGGHSILVSAGGRMVAEAEAGGVHHVTLPVMTKNPLIALSNARRLERLIRREGVAIVHARSRAPAWSALIAARQAKVRFVTTFHGIYSEKMPGKRFYNSIMARGDRVIANSEYTASTVRARYPWAGERLVVIPRGSDLTALRRDHVTQQRRARLLAAWGDLDGCRVILHLARLTSWKGQRAVIDAVHRLVSTGHDDVAAILAGSAQGRDGYRAELIARIHALGLNGRVRLVGHCDDVPAAFALADAAVVASVEPEAFGRAAVEAQAAGVPVVVTDIGATTETVLAPPQASETERTGWRVPPGNPHALAEALRATLSLDTAERQALRIRAWAHVERHFTVERMVERTLAVYRALA